jgi:hypothetical protein
MELTNEYACGWEYPELIFKYEVNNYPLHIKVQKGILYVDAYTFVRAFDDDLSTVRQFAQNDFVIDELKGIPIAWLSETGLRKIAPYMSFTYEASPLERSGTAYDEEVDFVLNDWINDLKDTALRKLT